MARDLASSTAAHERAFMHELSRVIHGIHAPFACGGSVVPIEPVAIELSDGTRFAIERARSAFDQQDSLEPLLARCRPAPFGQGRRTRYARDVRDAFQLDAAQGAFRVLGFDPQEDGILEHIQKALAPDDPNPITAELYGLNVYAAGGHFVPHKDTPRGSDMLGTLVVCLPSQFNNGKLVVSHRGVHEVFDWAESIRTQKESTRVHWGAFFGDVDHAIHKVWSGLRVTLSYILHRGSGAVLPKAPEGSARDRLCERLVAACADTRFFPGGGTLAFPCFHMYSHDTRFQAKVEPLTRATALGLKGSDQHVAMAAIDAGLGVTIQPYLVESCADLTWKLRHFPKPEAARKLQQRVCPEDLERALPLASREEEQDEHGVSWVVPRPQFNWGVVKPTPITDQELGADAPERDEPAIAFFRHCEYSDTGYFGNEGSDTSFYVYAALHVEVPPLGAASRASTKAVPRASTKAAKQRRRA